MKDRPSSNERLLDIDLENTVSLITYEQDSPLKSSKVKKGKSFKIKPMVNLLFKTLNNKASFKEKVLLEEMANQITLRKQI